MKLRVFLFLAIVSLTMPQHVFAGDDGDKAVFEQISVQETAAVIEGYNQGGTHFFEVLQLFKKMIDAKQFDVLEAHIKALNIQKFKDDFAEKCRGGAPRRWNRMEDHDVFVSYFCGCCINRITESGKVCAEQVIFFYKFVTQELPKVQISKSMNCSNLQSWQFPILAHFAAKVGVTKLKIGISEKFANCFELDVFLEACKATLVDLDMSELTMHFPEHAVQKLGILKGAPLEKLRLESGVSENIPLLVELLPTLTHLKSFDIRGSHINYEGSEKGDLKPLLEALQALPHLEALYLGGNKFNLSLHFKECMDLIAQMPALTVLDLSEMDLYRYERVYDQLAQMSSIKELSLRKNLFAGQMVGYDDGSKLTNPKDASVLGKFLAHFPNIEKLDVWDSSFHDDFVVGLARFHLSYVNRHLTHVNFGYYAYRHLGEEAQGEIKQFSSATKASLADTLPNAKVYF